MDYTDLLTAVKTNKNIDLIKQFKTLEFSAVHVCSVNNKVTGIVLYDSLHKIVLVPKKEQSDVYNDILYVLDRSNEIILTFNLSTKKGFGVKLLEAFLEQR